MLYQAYWRNRWNRILCNGYVKAANIDEAYDIMIEKLQEGYDVTAIYEAKEHQITPQSICVNFANTADYELF